MLVQEIAPSLWHWHATHPEWKQRVESYATRDDTRLVLFDPLLPPDSQQIWNDLMRLADGRAIAIALTTSYHARSTAKILERRAALEVWASETCRARVDFVTHAFTPPARVADLAQALPTGRGDEVVYWLEPQHALVTGDAVLGDKNDGASFCPASWLADGQTHADLARKLQPLAELEIRNLLLTHGRPLVGEAQAHLHRLLHERKGNR